MVTNAILHEFNASGRRMRSKFDDATDWTNFVYDEVTGNLIAEYSLISGTYSLSATNTWGAGLLKQQRECDTSNDWLGRNVSCNYVNK